MTIEERLEALEKENKQIKFEHTALKQQMHNMRKQMNRYDAWLDTINSPIYKRIWWFIKGYRFYRLGRWYGRDKEEHHYY